MDMVDEGKIHSEMTDEEIQDLVDSGLILADDVDKVKEKRYTAAKTEVEDLIKNGNTAGAIGRVEELVDKGIISKKDDLYQETYFSDSLGKCQSAKTVDDIEREEANLKNQLAAGKISQKDYDNLVDYMYQNAGGVLDKKSYSVVENLGPTRIDIGGKSLVADVYFKPNVESDIATVLNKINGGTPSHNSLTMFDGKLYIYRDGNWKNIAKKEIIDAYNKQLSYQAKPTAPKHKSMKTNSTTGSGSGTIKSGGVGNKNIVQTHK